MSKVKAWFRKKWDQLVVAWKAAPFWGKVGIAITVYPVVPTLALIWGLYGAGIIQWTNSVEGGPEFIEACKLSAEFIKYHGTVAMQAVKGLS